MLEAIVSTFPTLDNWQKRTSVLIAPEAGSEQAVDDEEWPYMPASTCAMIGLSSAREHLHAVRLLIEAKQLFPAATSTLARTALVGASTAVWMLEPDDRSVRLRRSLSFASLDYKHSLQFGADCKKYLPVDQMREDADQQMDRYRLRQTQVHDLLGHRGGLRDLNLSDEVIPTALAVAVPDASQRGQMLVRWRTMSGAAHAFAWHLFGNEGTTPHDLDPGGVGPISVAGDLETLLMDYFTAYHVSVAGWRLLDKRCAADPKSPKG